MTDLEQKALGLVNAQFREPWYKTWEDVPQGVFARAVLHAAKSIEEMKIVVRTLLTDSQRMIEALEAENERLRTAVGEIKEAWDWWNVDTYDRCASVVEDAIRAALGVKQ